MIMSHIGREQIAVAAAVKSPTALSEANRARYIMSNVQVLTAQVRMTNDGTTAPVAATTGRLQNPGDELEVWGISNLEKLIFIREGSTSAVVVFDHWGRGA